LVWVRFRLIKPIVYSEFQFHKRVDNLKEIIILCGLDAKIEYTSFSSSKYLISLKKISYIFIFFLLAQFLVSCAVEQAPLGGQIDDIPPIPDTLKSSKNNLLFFEKQPIELVFNEWVKLKNPGQIVVSPPLEFGLEAKLKKKSLLLSFDEEEVLRENTTYTINLGQAIVDFTVGNPMDNFTYVFSTGSFIDSLSVFGVVKNDFTGEPMENILVSLYDNMQDTAFFTSRPLYFSRTNEQGQFKINNVRSDSFRVYALDDKNLNYFKDQESEGMGFLDSIIFLDTSFTSPLNLGFYEPLSQPRITSKKHQYGQLSIALNRPVDQLDYFIEPQLDDLTTLFTGDSLLLWYKNKEERQLIITLSEEKKDTIDLIVLSDSIKYRSKLSLSSLNATSKKRLSPIDSLAMTFNTPIEAINREKIILKDTSGNNVDFDLFQENRDSRIVKMKAKWKEDIKYDLTLLPGAFTNHYETTSDTIEKIFFITKRDLLGEIIFQLDSLETEYQYIIELTQGKNVVKRLVSGKKSDNFTISSLSKGKYTVRVIEDRNKNGRWDPGDFLTRQTSEKWISKEMDELKAGWTLEVSINGEEFK